MQTMHIRLYEQTCMHAHTQAYIRMLPAHTHIHTTYTQHTYNIHANTKHGHTMHTHTNKQDKPPTQISHIQIAHTHTLHICILHIHTPDIAYIYGAHIQHTIHDHTQIWRTHTWSDRPETLMRDTNTT